MVTETNKFNTSITMLKKKVEEAINAQINAELWSAYLYLSMAAWCHASGKSGFAKWYEIQFKEEQDHAMILYNYIVTRGGVVDLRAIDAVPTKWESLLSLLEATLKHEEHVTSLISALYKVAGDENDYATQSRVKWLIDEQVEEEETARDLIDKLKMVDGNGYGLYMLDKEMGTRTYTQASPLSEDDD